MAWRCGKETRSRAESRALMPLRARTAWDSDGCADSWLWPSAAGIMQAVAAETECLSCVQDARADLPPRERLHVGPRWRVAHAFGTSLPGWLVMLPRRHVTALDQLTAEEAADLGPLLRSLARIEVADGPERRLRPGQADLQQPGQIQHLLRVPAAAPGAGRRRIS
jgi:hypothetical protein